MNTESDFPFSDSGSFVSLGLSSVVVLFLLFSVLDTPTSDSLLATSSISASFDLTSFGSWISLGSIILGVGFLTLNSNDGGVDFVLNSWRLSTAVVNLFRSVKFSPETV